jgi:hypothetical protein
MQVFQAYVLLLPDLLQKALDYTSYIACARNLRPVEYVKHRTVLLLK